MYYKENDNLDIERINYYRSLPKEELERLIEEKELEILIELEEFRKKKQEINLNSEDL